MISLQQAQRQLRDKDDQQKRDHEAENERYRVFSNDTRFRFHQWCDHEQIQAERRSRKADSQIAGHHNCKMDRADAEILYRYDQQRSQNRKNGTGIHEHTDDEHGEVYSDQESRRASECASQECGQHLRRLQQRQYTAERNCECKKQAHGGIGIDRLHEENLDITKTHRLVDEEGHDQRV